MSPCTLHRWSQSWCSSFAPVHPINAGMGPFGVVNARCAQLCGAALQEQAERGANAACVMLLHWMDQECFYSTAISVKGVV